MKRLFATAYKGSGPKLSGFTMVEVGVVVALLGLLFGLIWINLLSSRESAEQNTTVDTLVADIKSQQLKAMLGDTEGRLTSDAYGVLFGDDAYTLFHGTSFNPSDPSNYTVELGDNFVFSDVSFPGDVVIFTQLSGEVQSFVPGSNTLTIQSEQSGETTVLTLNAYGVFASIE